MPRVLTLSTLFPDRSRPNFGLFVERQTRSLAERGGVAVEVVAPLGIPPAGLGHLSHYRDLASLPPREQWNGLTVHRPRFPHLPGPAIRLAPWLMARTLMPVLERIRRDFPFEVIDAEYFWPDGPAAAALGKAFGVPVSIKARGSDIHDWGQRSFARKQMLEAGGAAGGMLAVSGALKRDMVAMGLPEEKIAVHHGGVDLDRFKIADRDAARLALSVEGPLVLCVGFLIDRKGQKIAVEAMKALPGTSLLIVGDGPARPALEKQIAKAGLRDRVRLLGALPHNQLPALFAAADVFVLPSESEGLANVWLEALACGTPIVIADAGGAREVVDTPAAGRIAARTPDAIADAIRDLIANPPGRAATRGTVEHFTWSANAEALHLHLSALVERHQRGGDPAILAS